MDIKTFFILIFMSALVYFGLYLDIPVASHLAYILLGLFTFAWLVASLMITETTKNFTSYKATKLRDNKVLEFALKSDLYLWGILGIYAMFTYILVEYQQSYIFSSIYLTSIIVFGYTVLRFKRFIRQGYAILFREEQKQEEK